MSGKPTSTWYWQYLSSSGYSHYSDVLAILRHLYKLIDQPTDLHQDKIMPKGTKVHKVYDALVNKGMGKGKAARIAQSKTGKSLATGKKPKRSK